MTALDVLSIRGRAILELWLLILLFAGFFILFRYIQRRRWWVRYIPLLVLMLAEYILFQIIAEIGSVVLSYSEPGRIFSLTHGIPCIAVTAAELFMTAVTVRLWYGIWNWQRHHITALSVQDGVDSLPAGMLYYWDDGRIKLVNRKMLQIARQLTGLSLQDGNRFMMRLQEGQKAGKDPILRLPDGSVWSFGSRETVLEGEVLHELIAVDVSEEFRLREELAEENRRLADMNRRLQNLNDMIGEITVEKETLAAKILIHDETGRTMLATRKFLEEDESGADRQELFEMWEKIAALPTAANAVDGGEDVTGDLQEAAEAIGIRLELIGEAHGRQVQKLLLAGARECLTNAYRHAKAGSLAIRIERAEKDTVITYTNDGAIPEGPIREGGGLSSLRRIVEAEGASMEVDCCPVYSLRIRIPAQTVH